MATVLLSVVKSGNISTRLWAGEEYGKSCLPPGSRQVWPSRAPRASSSSHSPHSSHPSSSSVHSISSGFSFDTFQVIWATFVINLVQFKGFTIEHRLQVKTLNLLWLDKYPHADLLKERKCLPISSRTSCVWDIESRRNSDKFWPRISREEGILTRDKEVSWKILPAPEPPLQYDF